MGNQAQEWGDSVNVDDLIQHCRKQQELQTSANPTVAFIIPGAWGKTSKKKLFKKVPRGMQNPTGNVIAAFPGRVMVEFAAQAVLDACLALRDRGIEVK